ncbi:MAG: ABC transporter permease [Armatimonadota bacterium]
MSAHTGVIPISDGQLMLSALLLLLTGGISALMGLGLWRNLLVGAVRTIVQLTVTGYVLVWLFHNANLWLVLLVFCVMSTAATHDALKRAPSAKGLPKWMAFTSLWTSTLLTAVIVLGCIIRPVPVWSPRVAIPICGMLLGNSMTAMSLSVESLFREARLRRDEIEQRLAMGASPWEAVIDSVKAALQVGMTPSINALMVVGIVSLPGMMTGQIIGGADPRMAVKYQIVVMFMMTTATAIGSLSIIGMAFRRLFSKEQALIS